MDEYPHIVELIAMWEEQARQASPADALLLNKQIRQLREALYTVLPAKHVLVPVESLRKIVDRHADHGGEGYAHDEAAELAAAMDVARPEVP